MWQTPIWMRFRRRTPRRIMLTTRLMEGMLMMSPLDDDDDTNDEDETFPLRRESGDTEAFETDKTAPTLVPSPRRHTARISTTISTITLVISTTLDSLTTTTTSTIITILTTTCTHIITITITTTTTTSSITVHTITSRPSTAAPRPTGGHRANYGFIGTMDAEIRRQRAEEVGYGIRDVWVDPTEAVEEVAPTTLEGVNARVAELAAVQEQDKLLATLGQVQALQARDQTHADDREGAGSSA
ncbi:hypothetical protein Tco_0890368 [Tanacetum coccineum]|uniref:Uncharacterized protein n=1 Tax=Tanacetum coccineum TaxID=301880 RepID=A0ABQ5C380_9ASTR